MIMAALDEAAEEGPRTYKCVLTVQLLLLSCSSHNLSHLRAHAFARSVTVARSSAVQASSSRRQDRKRAIVCGFPLCPYMMHTELYNNI